MNCIRPSGWTRACPACIFILVENDARKGGYRNPLAEAAAAAGVPMPSAEQLAGRLVRLLRQGRGWSQQEVANGMNTTFGYSWGQSTVGKIEAAQRPLRVNELADLAALFGVPVTQLLEPKLLLEESDDLSSLEADIRKLEEEQGRLGKERAAALEAHGATSARLAEVSSELARVRYSLEIMRGWHAAASEEGDPG